MSRYTESEAAFRKAIELDPKDAWNWTSFAILLADHLGRNGEAEAAYRKAIELDSEDDFSRSALADLLASHAQNSGESARLAIEGLRLKPNSKYSQIVFRELCFTQPESLRSVLPDVSHWCVEHPDDPGVLGFMVDAWIAFAKCTSPTEALAQLDAQPEEVRLAFETVRDAFLAHADKDHLHRLAPERRAPVLKLLEKMTAAS